MRKTHALVGLFLGCATTVGALSGCEEGASHGTGGEGGAASTSSTSALSGTGGSGEGGGTTGPCGAMGEACCPGQVCNDAETVCDDGVCTGCIARAVAGSTAFGGCVQNKAGTQLCWGDNDTDQVVCGGIGAYLPRVVEHAGAAQVGSVSGHVCAVAPDGKAYCWGDNLRGKAGRDPAVAGDRICPGAVTSLPGQVTQVAVAYTQTLAVQADGAVYGWGDNSWGQLFIDQTSDEDGYPTPQLMVWAPPSSRAIAMWKASCVLTLGKKVVCVGENEDYALGTAEELPSPSRVELELEGVEELAGGVGTACARTLSGEVWCWGDNRSGEIDATLPEFVGITRLTLPSPAKRIDVGWGFVCAILSDDSVYCRGSNSFKQLGGCDLNDSPGPQFLYLDAQRTQKLRAKELALGALHACAVDLNDQLWCWGDNRFFNTGTTEDLDPVCPPQRLSIACE